MKLSTVPGANSRQPIRFWGLVAALFLLGWWDASAQECRAISDCSSGRCLSTVVCDGSAPPRPSSHPQSTFSPSRLPEPTVAAIHASAPDTSGKVTLTGTVRGPSRVTEVKVNNVPLEVSLQQDGRFNVDRATRVGSNEFHLTVVDEFGRTSTAMVSVYRPPSAISDTVKLKRVALVVGNANYRDKPLMNPINDAEDVARLLSEAGFDVINLRDATIASLRNSVRIFGDRLVNADAGLFYFAGHATEVRGRNYLIPIGADIKREDEIPDQSLDLAALLEKIDTAKKSTVVILDACRDNPFARSFRTTASGLAKVDSPSGTLIAFATSPGRVAADGIGRNSPFTKHLVEELRRKNFPIEQALKNVRRKVLEETRGLQTPWESTSLIGDFSVFR